MAARAESCTTGTVPLVLLILPSPRLDDFGEAMPHLNESRGNRPALSFYKVLMFFRLYSSALSQGLNWVWP